MGTALLAGASVASVVIGLAAQSTLGNLIAGISITLYKPFRLGDVLQVAAPTGSDIGVVESISLGYTTLRAADGHQITLPNSVAASQVSINLTATFAPWPLTIAIKLSRDADIESARALALKVAGEHAGEKNVQGCYLTRIDATAINLELRVRANDASSRDALRGDLLRALSQRFIEAQVGTRSADMPSFA